MQEKKRKVEKLFSTNPMPPINERVKILIDYYAHGSVKRFSEIIKLSSSQKLNRIFNINVRNESYPEVSANILLSITNILSDVDAEWLLTGKGKMLKSGETTAPHINNDAGPPIEEAKPAPTQTVNSELIDKICQLSADNALIRRENEELKSENEVLKHEIEDLKNNRPLPASIPYDLARSSAPSLASEPDIEVYQGRYGNDKKQFKTPLNK